MSKDIVPFLPLVPTPTRSLGAALPRLATPAVTSPWTPRPMVEEPATPAAEVIDVAALEVEARERGRADGLAETAALRDQLTAVLAELAAARAELVAPAAELITEIVACVIDAWIAGTDRAALFAPIIGGWVARVPAQPATARVHPGDAAALAQVIGEAPLKIVEDAALAPGAVEIASPTLELSHDWQRRLGELRAAILAALTGVDP
jgi:flagellar biosynthesis/type III secretory pathway protein FliH